jgi:hypothetical protein
MRRLVLNAVIAALVGIGSLVTSDSGCAAIVNLSGVGPALNLAISEGGSGPIYFALPSDFASLNSIEFDFTYSSTGGSPSLGTASLEFVLGTDAGATPSEAFGVVGIYNLPAGIVAGSFDGSPINVGTPSFSFNLPLFGSVANLISLPATAPDFVAGSNIAMLVYNGADGFPSNVTVTVLSANLKLDYNTTGGGVVPEPSTLAIALVGLAGWRGRRMLRRS